MSVLETQIIMGVCLLGGLLIYGLIATTIRKSRTKKQRSKSSIHCHHCGEPMLNSDVFCENCWKITPKVQEMLNKQPNRNPTFYSNLSYKGKNHCPHCKMFYRDSGTIHSRIDYGTPIKCCTHCHQFFLDTWYFEWAIAPLSVKLDAFFFIHPYQFFLFILVLLCCICIGEWLITLNLGILFLGYCGLRIIWNITAKRKTIHKSYIRLEQNPEYPQILVDMGFINMMDKKYYHLSKVPIVSLKDKMKELLKDAFTFD